MIDTPFHILALSGGGFRGLYTAKILADLEEDIGEPIATRFDLIAGTSIGGILALGLACEIPAKELVVAFKRHGQEIFRCPWSAGIRHLLRYWELPPLQRLTMLGFLRATYSPKPLKAMLASDSIFGERLLGTCKHPVVIPTVNYTTGMPAMFKTPHHPTFSRDLKLKLVDVALATSAAPTYFPRHLVDNSQYVDGGLYANAPGLLALHEAIHFFDADPKKVSLLSIGTMSSRLTVNPSQNREGGMLGWGGINPGNTAKRLFSLQISAQESIAHFMLGHRLGDRYIQIDEVLTGDKLNAVALDKADPAAVEALEGSASQASKSALGKKEIRALLNYRAPAPTFFHGPGATRKE